MKYVIDDKRYHFKSAVDTGTGIYILTDILTIQDAIPDPPLGLCNDLDV